MSPRHGEGGRGPEERRVIDPRQAAYAERRLEHREAYLDWLATRELSGTPTTPHVADALAAEHEGPDEPIPGSRRSST